MSTNAVAVTEKLVKPILDELGFELVDVEFVKEGANWFLRVYIDKEDGVDIEDCSTVSERLSKKLDEADPIPQAYFLEVSSPGAERPLKSERDFDRALLKGVHIETSEPVGGDTIFEGILLDKDEMRLRLKIGKEEVEIPRNLIAKARMAVLL